MPYDDQSLPRVSVGPFAVADASTADVVAHAADLQAAGTSPARAFALHVGGLGSRHDRPFVEAMASAELVYADGASVVLIAKAAGAEHIERSPTTDIGWDLFRELTRRNGVAPVVSIIGGPPGLAERALDVLVDAGVARPGATAHGYQDSWPPVLEELREQPCDVLVVGLGAPFEMVWVEEHLSSLSCGLVLTCGGWLGFLAGEEARAPAWLQKLSLEWAYRLAQKPRQLAGRYFKGAFVTLRMVLEARFRRRRQGGPPRR